MNSFAYLFERYPRFVQTFCYREVEEMRRQGMAPLVVSIRRPDDPPDCAVALGGEVLYLPPTVAVLGAKKLPWRVRWTVPRAQRTKDVNRIFEAIWLRRELQKRGIRHVHAHFGGLAARTAWWLRKFSGIRYSFTGHANDIFCATDFPVSQAQLVADAEFVVTETDFARRWVEEKYPLAAGKVFRVFNGIAMDGFPPPGPGGPIPRIISVGRSVEKKGFGDLIEACRLLRESGQVFECVIVGGGPLDETLRMQIEAAKLEACVHLLGPRAHAEVRGLLAASQIFVLACVPDADGGSDNLPTVIMEAMAGGRPVVSTRIAGIPEMICDGEDGLLVAPHAPAELAGALAKLLNDPNMCKRLGENARHSAAAKFAIETTTCELKHLLVRLAGLEPPRRPEAA